jgi:hypothetical protein
MNFPVSEPAAASRSIRGIPLIRWAALGGIAYVVLFVVGFIVSNAGTPDTSDAPAKLSTYWKVGSHRDKAGLGWFLVILGVFFFLWFLAALRQAVRRLMGDALLTAVVTIGGVVYAASTIAAFSIDTAIKTMSDDTYKHTVYPGFIHAGDDIAYALHSGGGVGAAAMMIAASLASMASPSVPRWASWLGVIAGIAAIVSFFFFPWFAIAAWLVVASVLVFRAHVAPDATA